MGADRHAALSSSPVLYRKQTVSCFILLSLTALDDHYSLISNFSFVFGCFAFQEAQSSQSHTASPLPRLPPLPLTRAKKWAGTSRSVRKLVHFQISAFSQFELTLRVFVSKRVRSRGRHIVPQRRVGRRGAEAGREAQRADEGTDDAKDLGHAGPQSHDREAGEGGRQVSVNRDVLLPKKEEEQVRACKY